MRLLWSGQLVSNLGTQASLYGLGIWILQRDQTLLPLVGIAIAVQLAKVAVLPLVGPRLHLWPRRRLLLVANAVAALATLVLAGLLLTGALVGVLFATLLAVAAAAEAVLVLALATLIPALVPPHQLPKINGLLVSGDGLVQLTAPALGAALVATAGVPAVVTLDAVTFLAGMGCIALVQLPPWPEPGAGSAADHRQGFWATLRQLWSRISTRHLLLASWLQSFVLASTEVLFPAWVLVAFGAQWLAPALLLNGIAYSLGTLAWLRIGDQHRLVPGLMGLQALMLLGAALPGIAQWPLLWAGGVISFTTAVPLLLSALQGRWQRSIPPADHPRCFAVRFGGEWSARMLGLLTTAVLVDGLLRPWSAGGEPEALALAAVGGLLLLAVPCLR